VRDNDLKIMNMKKLCARSQFRDAFVGLILLTGGIGLRAARPIDSAPEKARSAQNPLADSDRARRAGRKLFQRECAECHGNAAEGLGKAPPLNLPAIADAPPGAIFWVLRNGSLYRGMPSFAALPDQQRWQIVTFLQALKK
jgi:mono/diheme cytochrome c family protein